MSSQYSGLQACNMSLSALHAEIEGLFWPTSCKRERRITSIRFEMDCSDLVDMTTNPVDWPIFTQRSRCSKYYRRISRMWACLIFLEVEWSGWHVSKTSKDQRLYFFPYISDSARQRCSSGNRLIWPPLDLL